MAGYPLCWAPPTALHSAAQAPSIGFISGICVLTSEWEHSLGFSVLDTSQYIVIIMHKTLQSISLLRRAYNKIYWELNVMPHGMLLFSIYGVLWILKVPDFGAFGFQFRYAQSYIILVLILINT